MAQQRRAFHDAQIALATAQCNLAQALIALLLSGQMERYEALDAAYALADKDTTICQAAAVAGIDTVVRALVETTFASQTADYSDYALFRVDGNKGPLLLKLAAEGGSTVYRPRFY